MLRAAFLIWFAAACVWAAAVDMRERRIPNGAALALAFGGLVEAVCTALLGVPSTLGLPGWIERCTWAALVLLGGLALELLWRASHDSRHGMGMGDVKLLAACALWLGDVVLCALMLACAVALLVELPRGNRTFAFGPYIVLASGACLLACAFV